MAMEELFERYKSAAEECYDPGFFSRDRILRYAGRMGINDDHLALLLSFRDFLDEAMLRHLWRIYHLLFLSGEDFSFDLGETERIPRPAAAEEKFPGCANSLIYLMAVDNLEKWLADKDLNRDEIIDSYFFRYREMGQLNTLSHDTYGICRLSYFMYGYAKPAILRVGRLDFQVNTYKNYCEMYEDKAGNRIFAALPNYTYNQSGLQESGGFTPVYEKNGDILTAHLFGEKGRLSPDPRKIDLSDLSLVLKPGDGVVSIHIPGGRKLYIDEVRESIREAYKIFKMYFPPFKTIVCQTWFIDPGLRGKIVRDGSNMAAFADLFDVISATENCNHSIFEHVFVTKKQPLEDLKPRNDFQRRLVERAMRGEKIYWSYGVLKKEVSAELFD